MESKEEKRTQRHLRYEQHKERELACAKKWALNNPEGVRAIKRRWGAKHKDAIRLANRTWKYKIKAEVLSYYGNGKLACVRCGESRLACLTIDHIEGGGISQRRKVNKTNIYNWLKQQGYPQGYQTLCMNCQWIKRYENNEFKATTNVLD